MIRDPKPILLLAVATLLSACGGGDDGAAADRAPVLDTTAVAPPPAAPLGPPVALSEFVGQWEVRSISESGDSLPDYRLDVVSDSAWTLTFADREPLPVQILAVEADSVITFVGPYESVIRDGVQVTLRTALRLRDGQLHGNGVARYRTSASDSLLVLRSEGSRIP